MLVWLPLVRVFVECLAFWDSVQGFCVAVLEFLKHNHNLRTLKHVHLGVNGLAFSYYLLVRLRVQTAVLLVR